MKKTIRNKPAGCSSLVRLVAVSLVLAGMIVPAQAQRAIRGRITRMDGTTVDGQLRWMPRSREYLVMDSEGRRYTVAERQVRDVRVMPPPRWKDIVNAFQAKQYPRVIKPLQSIMEEYIRMQYDVPAASMLTQAYMAIGQPAEAIKSAEVAISRNPNVWQDMDFARVYWQALAQAKSPKLRSVLQEAIERGSRETAAAAQVMRGNIDFDQGRYREALVDGYLRVIMLFKNVQQVQPEALYKAVRAHEQLGEHSHAEKFRRILLSEYPRSSYSRDLRSGN